MGISGRALGSGALGPAVPKATSMLLRLERPGLEAEPRLQNGGTSQNGREVKARPGVRLSSLASALRVLVMARVALEPSYG